LCKVEAYAKQVALALDGVMEAPPLEVELLEDWREVGF
jgi:hypothetical protein